MNKALSVPSEGRRVLVLQYAKSENLGHCVPPLDRVRLIASSDWRSHRHKRQQK